MSPPLLLPRLHLLMKFPHTWFTSSPIPTKNRNHTPNQMTSPLNPEKVFCTQCQTLILLPNTAAVVSEPRTLRGGGLGGLDPGFNEWYDVADRMQFANIAFLKGSGVEERNVLVQKEVGEGLGTQFVDEETMVLESLVEGGPAERNKMEAFVGWTLVQLDDTPISCCDDVRDVAPPLSVVTATFRRPSPARLLVCAGCESAVIGMTENGTACSIAAKLVSSGEGAKPITVMSPEDPQANQIRAMIEKEEKEKGEKEEAKGEEEEGA